MKEIRFLRRAITLKEWNRYMEAMMTDEGYQRHLKMLRLACENDKNYSVQHLYDQYVIYGMGSMAIKTVDIISKSSTNKMIGAYYLLTYYALTIPCAVFFNSIEGKDALLLIREDDGYYALHVGTKEEFSLMLSSFIKDEKLWEDYEVEDGVWCDEAEA